MALLLASNNAGKLREVRALLADVEVIAPAELDLQLCVEESGQTFAANAQLKARSYAAASGQIALADDSGLEVDALGGAPGIYSAATAAPASTTPAAFGSCSPSLRPILSQRNAKPDFAVICAVSPDGRQCQAEGTCEGLIAPAPAGTNGFGYDPVFFVPAYAKTMAQIDPQIKNRLSHRAQALAAVRPLLASTFPELAPLAH